MLLLKVVPPHFPAFNRAVSRIDGVKEWNGRVVVDVSTACTFSTLFVCVTSVLLAAVMPVKKTGLTGQMGHY